MTNVIKRETDNVFSERFYSHPEKINPRTNNNYFPAYHYVLKMGAPESIGLSKWRQTMGHFSDVILERSAAIGSYVHDMIDYMIKANIDVTHDQIGQAFPDEKEAYAVKENLVGFLNFISDHEPEVLRSEHMEIAEDFGFTLDMLGRINLDDYKSTWVLDWKTSKVASQDHKMQVEVMRRIVGADEAAVIVLGNTTKKKYTFTKVPKTERDYLWNRFQAIKETAYVEMLKSGSIRPRENTMPESFSLKNLKIKRSFERT